MNLRDYANKQIDVKTILKSFGIKYENGGDEYKICCPFHNDKSPSCHINNKKKRFHCFGCHAGGDIVLFLARLRYSDVGEIINEYTDINKFPQSLQDMKSDNPDPIDEDMEYIEKLDWALDCCHSFRNVYRREMIKDHPFSDAAKNYYDMDAYIEYLEYEKDITRIKIKMKNNP